jgi:hypothetical protein
VTVYWVFVGSAALIFIGSVVKLFWNDWRK